MIKPLPQFFFWFFSFNRKKEEKETLKTKRLNKMFQIYKYMFKLNLTSISPSGTSVNGAGAAASSLGRASSGLENRKNKSDRYVS